MKNNHRKHVLSGLRNYLKITGQDAYNYKYTKYEKLIEKKIQFHNAKFKANLFFTKSGTWVHFSRTLSKKTMILFIKK